MRTGDKFLFENSFLINVRMSHALLSRIGALSRMHWCITNVGRSVRCQIRYQSIKSNKETVSSTEQYNKFAEAQKRAPFSHFLKENKQWFGMGVGFLFASMMFVNVLQVYKGNNKEVINTNSNQNDIQIDNSHILYIEGMDEVNQLLMDNKYKNKDRIFLLFYASWCPDCVKARPIIDDNLYLLNTKNDLFINVYVGNPAYWRYEKNLFRTDKRFEINSIPTIIEYNTENKLIEVDCSKTNLVQKMFEKSVE
eukprot:216692_1